MRHRAVFVDTAPRPANQPPKSPHTQTSKASNVVISVILALLSIALMIGGVVMTNKNSTHHMHSHMVKEYKQFLLDWDNQYLPQFLGSEATLLLNGDFPVPAPQSRRPTKHTLIIPSPSAAAAAAGAQPQDQPDQDPQAAAAQTPAAAAAAGKPEKFRSQHVNFVSTGILAALSLPGAGKPLLLQPSSGAGPEAAQQRQEPTEPTIQPTAGGRARVTADMLQPADFKLLLKPSGGGEDSQGAVDLGSYALARVSNVTARSRRDCANHQWGMWDDASKQCTVVDYLAELCFKVQEGSGDASTQYSLEHGHGGTGCYPKQGWQPDTWRRARLQPRAAAAPAPGAPGAGAPWEAVLPAEAASSAPKLVIRHARDPELEERELLNRMNKIHQPAMAGHAVGLAMVFLGLVGICMLTCLAVPVLASFWKSVGRDDEDKDFE